MIRPPSARGPGHRSETREFRMKFLNENGPKCGPRNRPGHSGLPGRDSAPRTGTRRHHRPLGPRSRHGVKVRTGPETDGPEPAPGARMVSRETGGPVGEESRLTPRPRRLSRFSHRAHVRAAVLDHTRIEKRLPLGRQEAPCACTSVRRARLRLAEPIRALRLMLTVPSSLSVNRAKTSGGSGLKL